MTNTDALLSRTISVDSCPVELTYDAEECANYGYWLCKRCQRVFANSVPPFHTRGCEAYGRKPLEVPHCMVYVIGPNEEGQNAPFPLEDTAKILKLAQQMWPTPGCSCALI